MTPQLAIAVRSAIEAAGLTHLGVSESTGIPRTTLLRRLGGHSSFTVDELAAIAVVLDVRVGTLLERAEEVSA